MPLETLLATLTCWGGSSQVTELAAARGRREASSRPLCPPHPELIGTGWDLKQVKENTWFGNVMYFLLQTETLLSLYLVPQQPTPDGSQNFVSRLFSEHF